MSQSPDNSSPELWRSPFETLLASNPAQDPTPMGHAPIVSAPHEFGTPEVDAAFWEGPQSYPDTCAIRCQEFILEQFKGLDIPEDALVRQAMEHGWYAPQEGTPLENVGNLLELNGVPIHRFHDATVFNLSNELAQGHKVIVGVDSGGLWQQHPILHGIEQALGIAGADHAVVVSGIDTSDPDDVRVIISDPGTGQVAAAYPMDQFVDAWKESNFFMVATEQPPPQEFHLPEMANFDYTQGHIDQVWGMPYQEFLGYADQPDTWEDLLQQAMEDGSDNTGLFADVDLDAGGDLSDLSDHALAWESDYHDLLDHTTTDPDLDAWNTDHHQGLV